VTSCSQRRPKPSCGPLRCGPMFNCGICRTRTGQGMSLVDAVRPHPCVLDEGRGLSVLRPPLLWPQATSETLKGPSQSAHRELVDAVNDGNEECVAPRALRHASVCSPGVTGNSLLSRCAPKGGARRVSPPAHEAGPPVSARAAAGAPGPCVVVERFALAPKVGGERSCPETPLLPTRPRPWTPASRAAGAPFTT
jgi:hypothetical protein